MVLGWNLDRVSRFRRRTNRFSRETRFAREFVAPISGLSMVFFFFSCFTWKCNSFARDTLGSHRSKRQSGYRLDRIFSQLIHYRYNYREARNPKNIPRDCNLDRARSDRRASRTSHESFLVRAPLPPFPLSPAPPRAKNSFFRGGIPERFNSSPFLERLLGSVLGAATNPEHVEGVYLSVGGG